MGVPQTRAAPLVGAVMFTAGAVVSFQTTAYRGSERTSCMYRRVAASACIPSGTIRSFDPLAGEAGLTEFGVPTQHGVRMAELVHDIAPDARLVLVGYRTPEQFEQAATWVASEGIPIGGGPANSGWPTSWARFGS